MMMDDESVHMVVTSPPYYSPVKGLRKYGVATSHSDGWTGEIGSESTPQQYVSHLVSICNELRRVLRTDGTFWLNIGDSHAGSGCGPSGKNAAVKNQVERQGYNGKQEPIPAGFKRTDIFGIPFRLGIALQESGWYWKDCIPWVKHNGMPGSYKSRPVSNLEWILILTKSPAPYYDYVAVMQASSESYRKDKRPKAILRQRVNPDTKYDRDEIQFKKQDNTGNSTYTGFNARYAENGGGDKRLLRSSDFFFQSFQGLWLDENNEPLALIANTVGYAGHHFASFPVKLPEMCILASTSEKGVCEVCGAPWKRIVEKKSLICPTIGNDTQKQKVEPGNAQGLERTGGHVACHVGIIDWKPTCTCNAPIIPALVLDPFSGSSATGVACKWHNRNYIGIELNPEYCKLAEQRIKDGK
jgi:DNA modification methylase